MRKKLGFLVVMITCGVVRVRVANLLIEITLVTLIFLFMHFEKESWDLKNVGEPTHPDMHPSINSNQWKYLLLTYIFS